MALLGSLVVNVAADASKFQKGLNQAKSSLGSFASSAGAVAVGQLVASGIQAMASSLVGFVQEAFQSIDAVAKLSDRLNIATEDLVSLQFAADLSGVSAEDLTGALGKMTAKLGELQAGSAEARRMFAGLGVDVQALEGAGGGEAFGMIADAINALPTAAQRAAAAVDLFGKSGQGLLPLLAEGSAGFGRFREEADRLGITFSRVDARMVEAANDALSRAWTSVKGLGTQLAIQLSPYLEAAANQFTSMMTSGASWADTIISGLQTAGSVVAWFVDKWMELRLVWKFLELLWLRFQERVMVGIATILERLANLPRAFGGQSGMFGEAFMGSATVIFSLRDSIAEVEREGAALQQRMGAAGQSVQDFFDNFRQGARERAAASLEGDPQAGRGRAALEQQRALGEAVAKTEENLQQQVATYGMSSAAVEVYRLRTQGATEAQLANIRALQQQVAAQENVRMTLDYVGRVLEGLKTPMQKFAEEFERLAALDELGFFEPGQFRAAVEQAGQSLLGGQAEDTRGGPEALTRGSASQFSAVERALRGSSKKSLDDVVQELILNRAEQQRLRELAERVRNANAPLNIFGF